MSSAGKPIIRDMRIAVEHVLGMLAATAETILHEYPDLTDEDIQACRLFAHRSLSGEHVYERVSIRKPPTCVLHPVACTRYWLILTTNVVSARMGHATKNS